MKKIIVVKDMNVTRKVTELQNQTKMVPMTDFIDKNVIERKIRYENRTVPITTKVEDTRII